MMDVDRSSFGGKDVAGDGSGGKKECGTAGSSSSSSSSSPSMGLLEARKEEDCLRLVVFTDPGRDR